MPSNSSPLPTHCSGTKRATFLMASFICLCSLSSTLAACATTTRTVEYLPVNNMTKTCDTRTTAARNDSGCLEKSGTRCTIWTKDKAVSYSDFGALLRECIR